LVSKFSIESHQGSTGWTHEQIECSCGARLLRRVSFARAKSEDIKSSPRATAAALTYADRHSGDDVCGHRQGGTSKVTYASSEDVSVAMFPSLSREGEKADGLGESTGWNSAYRWSELRWTAASEMAKVAEADGFLFSAGRPCCACRPGGLRMAGSCSTSKRAEKENGVHERRLRRMALTSSGQEKERRKSKSACVQWSPGSPA
jgi:hypothetical protein